MRIRFGDFEIDVPLNELRRGDEPVAVEPQVFGVLAYLAEHRNRLIPKEELLDNVWGDRFVSESALTTRIKEARRAVGDDGDPNTSSRRSTAPVIGSWPPSTRQAPNP